MFTLELIAFFSILSVNLKIIWTKERVFKPNYEDCLLWGN